MKGEKFKLRNFFSRTSSLLRSTANLVGTSLEFAAFGSGPQPFMVSPEKHPRVYLDRAANDKQLVVLKSLGVVGVS